MTREEAINVIKGARQYLTVGNPIWNVKKVDEAFDMAIEALQDRPTDRLVKAFAESLTYEEVIRGEEYAKGYADGLKEQLADKPTGEWIHDGVDVEGGVDWMHCSNCGKSDVWADATRTNFCPNCGARMKGGAE